MNPLIPNRDSVKLNDWHVSPLCIPIPCAAQNNLSHSPPDWVPSDLLLTSDLWSVRAGTVAPVFTSDMWPQEAHPCAGSASGLMLADCVPISFMVMISKGYNNTQMDPWEFLLASLLKSISTTLSTGSH